MTANFNENSPGCECYSSSIIQRVSRRTEDGRGKTSRSRRSWEIEGEKNTE